MNLESDLDCYIMNYLSSIYKNKTHLNIVIVKIPSGIKILSRVRICISTKLQQDFQTNYLHMQFDIYIKLNHI